MIFGIVTSVGVGSGACTVLVLGGGLDVPERFVDGRLTMR